MKIQNILLLLGAVTLIAFNACRKDNFSTDPGAKVAFSQDTVFFDTLFTTIGSTTQAVRIYNNNNRDIKISSIELEGGADSPYRINVDGVSGDVFSDVEIASGDSLWMFVEVTIDPGDVNLPFIVEDRIHFTTNGNRQTVELVSWGQDAHFHGGPGALTVLDCNEVWNADKPHVVYGIVAVDEDCSLTINQGTQVYCHAKSGIYVFRGTLEVNGTIGNEVVFQGDRLEPEYQGVPGQWGIELQFEFETQFGVEQASVARGGIWLLQSPGSTINGAIIRDGNIGVQVDTTGTTGDALQITNTVIENMGVIGLLGQGAHISGWNNLIANCGQTCGAFTIGGRYRFAYTTFANYFAEGNRQAPTFALNNYYFDVNDNLQVRPLTDTWFHNCIMYGNNAALSDFNEFVVDIQQPEFQDYRFEFCAVDTDLDLSDVARFNQMVNSVTPPFVSAAGGDFHLVSSASSTWNGGFVSETWSPPTDLDGFTRLLPGRKGCYEGQ